MPEPELEEDVKSWDLIQNTPGAYLFRGKLRRVTPRPFVVYKGVRLPIDPELLTKISQNQPIKTGTSFVDLNDDVPYVYVFSKDIEPLDLAIWKVEDEEGIIDICKLENNDLRQGNTQNWFGTGTKISLVNAEGATHGYALRNLGGSSAYLAYDQNSQKPLITDKAYSIRFRARAESLPSNQRLYIDNGGTKIQAFIDSTDWKEYEIRLIKKPGIFHAGFEAANLTTPAVYLDWIKVYEASSINSTSPPVDVSGFDSEFSFETTNIPLAIESVTAQSEINPNTKIRFNKILDRAGIPQVMNVTLDETLFIVLAFTSDYINKPLQIIDVFGVVHDTLSDGVTPLVFTNGVVNL